MLGTLNVHKWVYTFKTYGERYLRLPLIGHPVTLVYARPIR